MNKIDEIPGLTEPKFCVRPRGLAKTETLSSEWGVSAPRGGQDTGPMRWSKGLWQVTQSRDLKQGREPSTSFPGEACAMQKKQPVRRPECGTEAPGRPRGCRAVGWAERR